MMNLKTIFALALAGASLSFAGAGNASTEPGSYSRIVSYADLNLATPAGEKALEERLGAAARQACRRVNRELAAQGSCRAHALALAAPRADAIVYAARYAGKTAQG